MAGAPTHESECSPSCYMNVDVTACRLSTLGTVLVPRQHRPARMASSPDPCLHGGNCQLRTCWGLQEGGYPEGSGHTCLRASDLLGHPPSQVSISHGGLVVPNPRASASTASSSSQWAIWKLPLLPDAQSLRGCCAYWVSHKTPKGTPVPALSMYANKVHREGYGSGHHRSYRNLGDRPEGRLPGGGGSQAAHSHLEQEGLMPIPLLSAAAEPDPFSMPDTLSQLI